MFKAKKFFHFRNFSVGFRISMVVPIIMVINSVIDGFAWWTQYDWLLQLSDYSQVSDDSCIK